MSRILPLLLLLQALPAVAQAQAAPPATATQDPPALGWDWMDLPDPRDASATAPRWPRDDHAAAGFEDMIHDECDGFGTRRCTDRGSFRPRRGIGPALHGLAADVMIPFAHFHF